MSVKQILVLVLMWLVILRYFLEVTLLKKNKTLNLIFCDLKSFQNHQNRKICFTDIFFLSVYAQTSLLEVAKILNKKNLVNVFNKVNEHSI